MKQLNIAGNVLTQLCRLCLTRGMTMTDIFRSCVLGKEIADVIMQCAPVQITRHDEMPPYICQLCLSQLKNFHQFQMQVVQSDKTLHHYLQQLSDRQQHIEEKQTDDSISLQNYNPDVTAKCEPFEISDAVDNFFSKQEVLENFSSVNKANDELSLNVEIKEEPEDNSSLFPAECADTVETLSVCGVSEISCEDSMIEVGDTKVGILECPIKFENDTTGQIPLKTKETYIPLSEGDSSLCSENVRYLECHRSNEDDVNKTDYPTKSKNLKEESQDFRNVLLQKSANSTKRKSYRCDFCQKCFKYASHLERHNLMHTGEKLYQCDICQQRFRVLQTLKKHNLMHTGEKPYQCNICQKRFRVVQTLTKHNLVHTGEKPYQCNICQKRFSDSGNLKKHILIHTEEKPHQCDICQTRFRHLQQLKIHKLIHTGERPYQCDFCQTRFRLLGNLKKHNLIHTGEKPYQCDICQKRFRVLQTLKKHNLIHTGEKPYQCDICQKRFSDSGNLKKHILIHTEEKPYQCDICQTHFRHLQQLKIHKLMHTGERPYQCNICQMGFRQAGHLKSHKLKHTE